MSAVFIDAVHYIALLSRRDAFHEKALSVHKQLASQQDTSFVTTDAVFVEVLAYFSEGGSFARRRAVDLVDRARSDRRTTVLPQTRALFDAGLDLYRRRLDKGYSLTDCMSMAVCRQRRITRVLTHDDHFAQERLQPLL